MVGMVYTEDEMTYDENEFPMVFSESKPIVFSENEPIVLGDGKIIELKSLFFCPLGRLLTGNGIAEGAYVFGYYLVNINHHKHNCKGFISCNCKKYNYAFVGQIYLLCGCGRIDYVLKVDDVSFNVTFKNIENKNFFK